jgi:hypothetical protein
MEAHPDRRLRPNWPLTTKLLMALSLKPSRWLTLAKIWLNCKRLLVMLPPSMMQYEMALLLLLMCSEQAAGSYDDSTI